MRQLTEKEMLGEILRVIVRAAVELIKGEEWVLHLEAVVKIKQDQIVLIPFDMLNDDYLSGCRGLLSLTNHLSEGPFLSLSRGEEL